MKKTWVRTLFLEIILPIGLGLVVGLVMVMITDGKERIAPWIKWRKKRLTSKITSSKKALESKKLERDLRKIAPLFGLDSKYWDILQ